MLCSAWNSGAGVELIQRKPRVKSCSICTRISQIWPLLPVWELLSWMSFWWLKRFLPAHQASFPDAILLPECFSGVAASPRRLGFHVTRIMPAIGGVRQPRGWRGLFSQKSSRKEKQAISNGAILAGDPSHTDRNCATDVGMTQALENPVPLSLIQYKNASHSWLRKQRCGPWLPYSSVPVHRGLWRNSGLSK